MSGGFRNPVLPILGYTKRNAGFRTPIPQILPYSSDQAGFASVIPCLGFPSSAPTIDPMLAYQRLALRDIHYEALLLTIGGSDRHDMNREYWKTMFGGNGTANDIMYEGIVLNLGFSTLKDYYDSITGTVWPDESEAARQYWLKIIEDNL